MKHPQSTYRLQLKKDFGFKEAAAIVPYLAKLGISHVYCSPYLKARPGSTHGYDIVDHQSLNPELGSEDDYDHFIRVLKKHGMGQVLDIVPNHMGVGGSDNAIWLDVLENGEASKYAFSLILIGDRQNWSCVAKFCCPFWENLMAMPWSMVICNYA